MKFFFVTYCFGNTLGQALIGVYKRGLRAALELCDRGHQIAFLCSGRENFHDSLTALAQERMDFVDIPREEPAYERAARNRALFLERIAELDPDVVVIGEAPWAGSLLETTLCAVELGIPVVCLDNAYQPALVDLFCLYFGGMFDGIVLTGPSSLHVSDPPPYLRQVPPYVEPDAGAAQAVLASELRQAGDGFVVVMAYDRNVEHLGISLMQKLDVPGLAWLFLTPDVERVEQQLAPLPRPVRARARAIQPPPERVLFGLLQLARLAIGKCAFMQVTECLSLRTPIVAFHFAGDFSLDYLPRAYRTFIHTTSDPGTDAATVAAADRLLHIDPKAMNVIHNGEQNATATTAAFLEALPRTPRQDTWVNCDRLGFTSDRVCAALDVLESAGSPALHQVRASYLRGMPNQVVFSLVCAYSSCGTRRFARLWGRIFRSRAAAEAEILEATAPHTRRQLLYVSAADRLLIERDLGVAVLPSTEECVSMGEAFVPPPGNPFRDAG